MNKKYSVRFLSILLSLLLTFSVPLAAYADADEAVLAETESVSEGESSQEDSSYENLEEMLENGDAFLLEGEDGSDELYLAEIIEDEDEGELEYDPEDSANESIKDAAEELSADPDDSEAEEDASAEESSFSFEDIPEASKDTLILEEDDSFAVSEESVGAADADISVYYSGSCGPNARWEITYNWDTSRWALSITGTGSMYNYSYTYDDYNGKYVTTAPWGTYDYSDKIVIGNGITSIGSYAFYGMNAAKTVSIASSVTSIGSYAFYNCSSLSAVTVPSSVSSLGTYSLYSFSDIYYPGTSSQWSSIGGYNSYYSYYTTVHFTTSIGEATISLRKTRYAYTGSAIKPAVTVKYNYRTLSKGTDYKVTYKNNKKVGTATVIIRGIHDFHGTVKKTFKIVRRSIAKATVTGVKNKPYTGKAVKLSLKVKVKVGSKYVTLKRGRDYVVKYYNNKKISTSKSKARVVIAGRGNYTGTIKKTFKIVKANPGLKFSKSKLTRVSKGSFTKKPTKKVSAKLTYTYKSSNPKVASVNKKTGKVTPKKVGTTKITVTSKATKHYKAGKASYTLKIRPFKQTELNYWFSNYSTSYIPLETFRIFFGYTEASTYYRYYSGGGVNGVCFGMSASSMMFNTAGSGLTKKNFSSSASRLYDLYKSDTYKSSGITLQELIEAMFVSQTGEKVQNVLNKNKNKYSALVKSVRSGKPTMICVWSGYGGGHAVVAYKAQNVGSTTRIYVYDCNHPTDSSRYITLYRSGSYYYGWYYDLGSESWSSSAGTISYISAESYRSIWKNRKGSSAISKMIVSSDDFEILNSDGELVAYMVNGEFYSGSDDIYLMMTAGEQPDAHLVYVPLGAYTINNTSSGESGFEVTALNVDQSITVSTESNSVFMDVDDEKEVNLASFEAEKGAAYEVSLMSDLPSAEGMEEVSFSGIGTGEEVTLGTEEGACVIEKAEDVSLEINGEEVAYIIFDGEAVIDE